MNSTSAEPEAIDTPQSDELKRWSTIQSGDVPVDGRSLSSEERKRSFKGKNDGNTGVDLTKPMDSKTYSNKSSSSSLSSKDASGSSGVFAETQKVHLLSPDDQSLVVARGEVVKIYPTDEVWGTKLGRRFVGRLTVEYFKNPSSYTEMQNAEKSENQVIQQHYVIFSKNVLASSVTVNSTVMNAKVSRNLVFHLLTDEQNYYTMKLWFSQHSYKDAIVEVLNMESFSFKSSRNSNPLHMSFSEEFRISILKSNQSSSGQIRTEYISIFGHSHFLLPDMFKTLKRVVILDDDIVVQKDLSPLWSLDLKGMVNGAVQLCKVRLGHLKHYLGGQSINSDSCAWTSGLNIVDLEKWREHNITATYQILHKKILNMNLSSWRAASLPISLLAFEDHIYPLSDTWILSGLGKDYRVSKNTISKAGVLHYSGNMKPWLEFGIRKYKSYWMNFLAQGDQYMDECNVIF